MFLIANFLIAVATIIGIILKLLLLLIIAYVIISWLSADPGNPIVSFINQCVEPLLRPLMRRMPPHLRGWSPFVASLIIIFLQIFLVASIMEFAYGLKMKRRQPQYQLMQSDSAGETLLAHDDVLVR